jgi:glycosyltransferase involved in cell wall biosynthesis
LGASCASGVTYLRNILPHLSGQTGVHTTIAVNRKFRDELAGLGDFSVCNFDVPAGVARRFWFEQTALPGFIRTSAADVLISAGNFAIRNSPIPQILLSGNSLYTCADFCRDLCCRREYRLLLDHQIKSFFAKQSIYWSDATIAPSRVFADELRRWTGKKVLHVYHGFDPNVFFADKRPLRPDVQQKLDSAPDSLRLLFVSHYNYYRNFETLLTAIPMLRERLGKKVRLFLTCHLRTQDNPGSFRADRAAALVRQLEIEKEIVELGAIPYSSLHHVYKACDLYVSPAYAESFAHPLVEAMACGLPVVASDLPVHREICGPVAIYFQRFSPEELCQQIMRVVESGDLRQELSRNARVRSLDFSWARHVDQLLSVAAEFVQAPATLTYGPGHSTHGSSLTSDLPRKQSA